MFRGPRVMDMEQSGKIACRETNKNAFTTHTASLSWLCFIAMLTQLSTILPLWKMDIGWAYVFLMTLRQCHQRYLGRGGRCEERIRGSRREEAQGWILSVGIYVSVERASGKPQYYHFMKKVRGLERSFSKIKFLKKAIVFEHA